MEEKVIIKLSRRIEYLVHKRHRSLAHIQKAIAENPFQASVTDANKGQKKEGVFWMNSIYLNKRIVQTMISQAYSPAELKLK